MTPIFVDVESKIVLKVASKYVKITDDSYKLVPSISMATFYTNDDNLYKIIKILETNHKDLKITKLKIYIESHITYIYDEATYNSRVF